MKPKSKIKPSNNPTARTNIVSFRMRRGEMAMLAEALNNRRAAGSASPKQFARQLCIDAISGRLVYINERDRDISPSSRDYLDNPSPPPNCHIPSFKFIKALKAYLSTPDSWNRLRYFMLRAGWSKDSLTIYDAAQNDQQRLQIAQAELSKMLTSL